MKTLALLALFFLPLTFSFQEPTSKQTKMDFGQLDFLLGQWNRTNGKQGTRAYEQWTKTSDQVLTGIGVTMRGTDTTFVEELRIEIKDNKIYYVADVRENTSPTYFLISEITDHSFTSKNPEHDFPKEISYSLKDQVLTAIISDGKEKRIPFIFEKGN